MIPDTIPVCPECDIVQEFEKKFTENVDFRIQCTCGAFLDISVRVEIIVHFDIESTVELDTIAEEMDAEFDDSE